MPADAPVIESLRARFGEDAAVVQPTADGVATAWVPQEQLHGVLEWAAREHDDRYRVLCDLTAIDERGRQISAPTPSGGAATEADSPESVDFSVVYHLMSYEANTDLRLKVALTGEYPSTPTVSDIWPAAAWYEREVFDMFGIGFEGHSHLRRILMPPDWEGHPLHRNGPLPASRGDPQRPRRGPPVSP